MAEIQRKAMLTRRELIGALSLGAAGVLGARRGFAQATEPEKPRFLIVLAAAGGGSIIDSLLAYRHSETSSWQNVNCFPDSEVIDVAGSPFRAVDLRRSQAGQIPIPFSTRQSAFVAKHKQDLMVATLTGTSVNHQVAQRRSITGNEAWGGRTLQEAVAKQYGAGFTLPNVNMTGGGFIEHGTDRSLPAWCFHEPVANALVWPLGLDGSKGQTDLPSRALIGRARALRNEKLDPEAPFHRTFGASPRLVRWLEQRGAPQRALESADLITRLNVVPDVPQFPLSRHGLAESPDGAKVRAKFPRFVDDPLEAQAALAFLLIKNRVSVSVTISPSFSVLLDQSQLQLVNPPLAFDYSHNAHRPAQAIMWDRIFRIADGLIDLLKAEPFDETTGESFWDRTLIYVATDFGRDKRRRGGADDFGTGHHLNNGVLILSPLANGNRVLGGVDKDTGLTYGFDLATGAPDRGRTTAEREIFAGILQALGVDTSGSGLPDVRAMRKRA